MIMEACEARLVRMGTGDTGCAGIHNATSLDVRRLREVNHDGGGARMAIWKRSGLDRSVATTPSMVSL